MRKNLFLWAIAVIALIALPPLMSALNQPFYIDLVRRVMIFAIAAISLNLILGYGGMVSFGHAAYLGIGAYAVGILAFYGVTNGFLQFAVAIVASALVAAAIGCAKPARPEIRADGLRVALFEQAMWDEGFGFEDAGDAREEGGNSGFLISFGLR